MFNPAFVCLFVCVLATSRKNNYSDTHEYSTHMCVLNKEDIVNFWKSAVSRL